MGGTGQLFPPATNNGGPSLNELLANLISNQQSNKDVMNRDVYDTPFEGRPNTLVDAAMISRIMEDILPRIAGANRSQYVPEAQAQLAASQAVSPGYQDLMTKLYAQYGPQLSKIGSDITAQNQQADVNTSTNVLNNGGMDLLKMLNPEYFQQREQTSGRLSDLMNSIDLSGGLSDVERREIEQGLSREGQSRGTSGAPSNTETISNAMQYGQAGRNRVVENQNQLSKALAASTAFLPASQLGAEQFAIGTGKTSGTNPGAANFLGVKEPNLNAPNAQSNSLLGNSYASATNASNLQAGKKDWLDQFVQFTQGLSNIGQTVGGFMGA